MSATEKHPNLASALAAFQAEMPTVAKTKKANVGQYSYSYADLADVTGAAAPVLSKHGLAFAGSARHVDGGRYEVVGILSHESGEQREGALGIPSGNPQQVGGAITYMRRYLYGLMTGIVTDDDDDGRLASAKRAKPDSSAAAPQWSDEPPDLRHPGDRQAESPHLDTTSPLAKAMFAALGDIGKKDKADRLAYVSKVIGREITGSAEMTDADAHAVLKQAKADLEQPFPGDAA